MPAVTTSLQGPQKANLPPFRSAATRHRNISYTRSWTTGQPIYINLNRQGYLAALRFNLALTVTASTAAASGDLPDPDVLTNFFPLIALKSPQGDYLVSVSSRDLLDFNFRLRYALQNCYTTQSGTASTHTQTGILDPSFVGINPASTSAQSINVNFELPISLNDGLNFETGLLMRQLASNDFQLQLNCAALSDLGNVGTSGHWTISTITGTVYIEEVWYEAVNPNAVTPPDFAAIIKLRNSTFGPCVIGDNFVPYSTGPTLLDAIHRVQDGTAASTTNVNYLKMLANRQTEIENRRSADIQRDNFWKLGKNMRNGIYHIDFFDDSDVCNQSRARDFINSNMAAQLDTVVNTLAAFTTAGSAIYSFYRELVTLGA